MALQHIEQGVPGELAWDLAGGFPSVFAGIDVAAVELLGQEQDEPAGILVEADVGLPGDARVSRALFDLSARATGATEVSTVAQVRPATPAAAGASAACTVDLGGLVTVAGLQPPLLSQASVDRVYPWTGAAWGRAVAGAAFPEVLTERLLVETDADVSEDAFADFLRDSVDILLPVTPTGLELLIDGVTVWFERQGSAPGETPPAVAEGGVAYVVDRTSAFVQALERAAPVGGRRTVRTALRAATPGALALGPRPHILRVHTATFPPEGLRRTIDVPEEGLLSVAVTPPPPVEEVREVALVVRGSFPPDRIQPAAGPALEAEARLVLAAGRPVLLGLPAAIAGRFGTVTGVRLHLTAIAAGGVVGGRLLADAGGGPGEPVDGGELAPFTVPPGLTGWSTLALAAGVEAAALAQAEPSEVAAWLELQLSDGEVECSLTQAAPDASEAPPARLLRRLPGGGTGTFTHVGGFLPFAAALRVVGRPGPSAPLPAVTFGVARAGQAPPAAPELPGHEAGATVAGVDPSGEDLGVTISLAEPIRPGADDVLLTALVAAPGSLTIDTVRVAYVEGGP